MVTRGRLQVSAKAAVRRSVLHPLARLGTLRLAHRLFYPGHLAVLTYHAVVRVPLPVSDWCFLREDLFREHMAYLHAHLDVLPLVEAVERLRAGTLRRPSAVITFDDGYRNNYELAFPVLRDLGLPATIFLNTTYLGTADTVWFCRLHQALIETSSPTVSYHGVVYPLTTTAARAVASAALQERLKDLDLPLLDAEVKALIEKLGIDPTAPLPEGSPYRMLDPAQVRSMADSGLVEFGAHTHTHAILTRLSGPRREREITDSVREVAAVTGRPCRSFAYPNGRQQDYAASDQLVLRAAGVQVAVTTIEGPNTRATPPLEVRRYGVGDNVSALDFPWLVHHMHI